MENPTIHETVLLHALENVIREDGRDLTMRQMAILLVAYQSGDCHPPNETSLATRLGIVRPAVTRSIDKLADLDLITRLKDDEDHRMIRVVATPEGVQFINRVIGRLAPTGAQ